MKDKEKRARWLKRQRKAAARRAAGQTAATTATVEPGAAQEREPRRGRTQPGASGAADARERTGAANTGTVGAGCGAHGAGAGGRTGAVEAKRQEANSVTPAEMVAMANGIGEALAKGVRLDSLDPVLAKLDTALAGMSDAAVARLFHELSADAARSARESRGRDRGTGEPPLPERNGAEKEVGATHAPLSSPPSTTPGSGGSESAGDSAGERSRRRGGTVSGAMPGGRNDTRGEPDPAEAATQPEPGATRRPGPPPEVTPDLVIRVARRIWDGARVSEAIEAEGVSEARFYAQTTLDPELRTVARCMGFTGVGARIEQRILQEAVRGRLEPVFFEGEEIGEKRVYSDGLLIWLLQRYVPERYGQGGKRAERDRMELDRLAPDAAARAKKIGLVAAEAAFERALEGVEQPVFRRGERVGSVRVYSEKLLKFLLLAERRAEMLPEPEEPPPSTPGAAGANDAAAPLASGAGGRPGAEPTVSAQSAALSELPDKGAAGVAGKGQGTAELPDTGKEREAARAGSEMADPVAPACPEDATGPEELPDTQPNGQPRGASAATESPDSAGHA